MFLKHSMQLVFHNEMGAAAALGLTPDSVRCSGSSSAARLSVLLHNWSSISIFNIFVPLLIFHHKLDNLFMF